MTTDLSKYDPTVLPGADVLKHQRYAIIVADWNSEITYAMADGARQTLIKHGVDEDNISFTHVPGTVELTYAARVMMNREKPHAIIVIGCVIQGDTGRCPVIFSVLTTLDKQQALDRAGGRLGNKGIEGAVTAIQMANI